MSNDTPPGRNWFELPVLTQKRMVAAFTIAVVADALQVAMVGIPLADQVVDVIAMVLTSLAVGFHPLLLPTFILELVPVADMLPTWTACVAAVVFLRRKTLVRSPPIQPAVTAEPAPEIKPPPKMLAGP